MTVHHDIAVLDPAHAIRVGGQRLGGPTTFAVTDPATGTVIAEVADGTERDAQAAVAAAAVAFANWSTTPPRRRADILHRTFVIMNTEIERLSALVCAENGKTQADARAEIAYAAEFFRWYGEEAVRTGGGYGTNPTGDATTSRELGGNAAFVVTADADLDAAVDAAMIAQIRGGGQACTAANRFYVHAEIADEFVRRFGEATAALRVGPASDPDSQLGPLISARAAARVRQLIDTAVADGATIAYQATIPAPEGNYVAPTVLTDVHPDASILTHEIFGPVAPIVVWDDESDMLRRIGDGEYGLVGYVFAGRLQDALRIAEATEAGMVAINRGTLSDPSAPFGGAKQSGLGREGARHGLRELQEVQYLSVATP